MLPHVNWCWVQSAGQDSAVSLTASLSRMVLSVEMPAQSATLLITAQETRQTAPEMCTFRTLPSAGVTIHTVILDNATQETVNVWNIFKQVSHSELHVRTCNNATHVVTNANMYSTHHCGCSRDSEI